MIATQSRYLIVPSTHTNSFPNPDATKQLQIPSRGHNMTDHANSAVQNLTYLYTYILLQNVAIVCSYFFTGGKHWQ